MLEELRMVKLGLALVFLSLAFGIWMGVTFGVNEDAYKSYIAQKVAGHPEVHEEEERDQDRPFEAADARGQKRDHRALYQPTAQDR